VSARYFMRRANAQTRSDYWSDEGLVLNSLSVPEHEAADTGLIDANGESIMRAPNPMGFVWEDWS